MINKEICEVASEFFGAQKKTENEDLEEMKKKRIELLRRRRGIKEQGGEGMDDTEWEEVQSQLKMT
jgi:hypothetical protein